MILVSDAGALRLSAFLSKITVSLSIFTSRTISASVSKSELKEAKALIDNVPNSTAAQSSTDIIFFKEITHLKIYAESNTIKV